MKEFISFPKITLIKQIVQNVNHLAHYIGQDSNDEPLYNYNIPNPTLKFHGTVKLHGTNAGVSYNRIDGIWAQSRNDIITIEEDNAGFAKFVEKNKKVFEDLFKRLEYLIKDDDTIITIFGEWAGGNIQSGVAINGIEKFLSIFAVKVSLSKENRYYLPKEDYSNLHNHETRIFNTVSDFKTWDIDIDFNYVERSIQQLIDLTDSVENECPVGLYFDKSGIGEGIVWVHTSDKYGTIRFKVKGQKHSTSKVRKIVAIDSEILSSVEEFVEYSVTENRLNQAIEVIFTQKSKDIDIKELASFLRWISNDISTEEKDALISSGLSMKQVGSKISTKARLWFLNKINY